MIATTEAPPMAVMSDASILESVAAGDSSGLHRLYDQFGCQMLAAAYQILGDNGSAEDAVQDVLLVIWQRAASYDQRRGNPRAWLLATVRHRCIDMLRRRRVSGYILANEDDFGDVDADDVWDSIGSKIAAEEVRRALATLPVDQRTTVYLTYYHGMTNAQIASHLQIPLGTVKARMRLGMGKLRKELQGSNCDELSA